MAIALDRLSELNAVSGFEGEAREYLIPILKEKCDNIEVDSMGNIICFKRGVSNKHTVLIGTNIDEVGFIVSNITDTGFIKFKAVGVTDPRTLISKTVTIGKERVKGVIGMKAIHLQKREERESAVKVSDLYIDIGETKKKDAEKRVQLGDMIAFDTKFSEIGDIIKGKALDRFGITAVISAMDEKPAYDTYYVFSTQREIPCAVMGRGMRIAAFRIKPDYALIVNTINSDDFYGSKSVAAKLGEGVAIEYMDRGSISNTVFLNKIANLAKKNSILVQDKTASLGTSVTGAVNTASCGAVTASIAIPCRYSHTPVSYMNINDINAAGELCAVFARESDVIINEFIEETNGN